MPKKKTGARKKAEKQRERQKGIKAASESRSIVQRPCNQLMVSVFGVLAMTYLVSSPVLVWGLGTRLVLIVHCEPVPRQFHHHCGLPLFFRPEVLSVL